MQSKFSKIENILRKNLISPFFVFLKKLYIKKIKSSCLVLLRRNYFNFFTSSKYSNGHSINNDSNDFDDNFNSDNDKKSIEKIQVTPLHKLAGKVDLEKEQDNKIIENIQVIPLIKLIEEQQDKKIIENIQNGPLLKPTEKVDLEKRVKFLLPENKQNSVNKDTQQKKWFRKHVFYFKNEEIIIDCSHFHNEGNRNLRYHLIRKDNHDHHSNRTENIIQDDPSKVIESIKSLPKKNPYFCTLNRINNPFRLLKKLQSICKEFIKKLKKNKVDQEAKISLKDSINRREKKMLNWKKQLPIYLTKENKLNNELHKENEIRKTHLNVTKQLSILTVKHINPFFSSKKIFSKNTTKYIVQKSLDDQTNLTKIKINPKLINKIYQIGGLNKLVKKIQNKFLINKNHFNKLNNKLKQKSKFTIRNSLVSKKNLFNLDFYVKFIQFHWKKSILKLKKKKLLMTKYNKLTPPSFHKLNKKRIINLQISLLNKIKRKFKNYFFIKKINERKISKIVINPKIYIKKYKTLYFDKYAYYILKIIKTIKIKKEIKLKTNKIYSLRNKLDFKQSLRHAFIKILNKTNLFKNLNIIIAKYEIKKGFTINNFFNKLRKNGFSKKLKNVSIILLI